MASLSFTQFLIFSIEPWVVLITIKGCARHVFRDKIMGQTPITVELLLKEGFVKGTMNDKIIYKKGKIAIMHDLSWIPINLDFNRPMINGYVNTWEEFEKLIEESKSK